MAQKITRDTGMMQEPATKYNMKDSSDADQLSRALRALTASLPAAMPGDWTGDALRRSNAERCRAILATVGLTDDGICALDTGPLREKGLAENSAQWIAAQWLAEYNALMRGRERFGDGDATPGNLGRMLMATEEMGRLQERMWWRVGVEKINPGDPESWRKREDLALSGKRQAKGGHDGNAMRTNTSFRAIHGDDAQAYADDLHRQKPRLTWSAIRIAVGLRFNVSAETVKKSLINPKKHG